MPECRKSGSFEHPGVGFLMLDLCAELAPPNGIFLPIELNSERAGKSGLIISF